jgi:hypothetical protein
MPKNRADTHMGGQSVAETTGANLQKAYDFGHLVWISEFLARTLLEAYSV